MKPPPNAKQDKTTEDHSEDADADADTDAQNGESTVLPYSYQIPQPHGYIPPPYQHYPQTTPGTEPPFYYCPPPPPVLYTHMHGYPYVPQLYPPPPPGVQMHPYFPKAASPIHTRKASPRSSTKSTFNAKSENVSSNTKGTTMTEPSGKHKGSPTIGNASSSSDDVFLSNVKPMRSDFFIFASENKDSLIKTLPSADSQSPLDTFTNLNEKLLNMWETASSSFRQQYEAKESADQIRFMNEDEVESRHCATLTSRVSLSKSNQESNKVETSPSNGSKEKLNSVKSRREEIQGEVDHESPTKKAKEDFRQ